MAKTFTAYKRKVDNTVKREGTLRESYQALGVEALERLKEHGNTHYVAYLVNQMGVNSTYRKPMLDWVKRFAPITTKVGDKETNSLVFAFKKGKKPEDVDAEGAAKVNFWLDQHGNAPGRIYDEAEAILKLLERNGKVKTGERDQPANVTEMKLIGDDKRRQIMALLAA